MNDIQAVERPSLLNVRDLTILAGMLLVWAVAVGIQNWAPERTVRRQTTALADRIRTEAAMVRRCSLILEPINPPLARILAEVTEMVSFSMGGAPCWCEVADRARRGSTPPNAAEVRVDSAAIPSRSGPALGKLFAGLALGSAASPEETGALAIETQRLYFDGQAGSGRRP